MKKINKNVLYGLLNQAVLLVLGLLLPRVILVGFGSEVNGLLNSVTQIIAYMAVFEAGIQSVALKSLYRALATDDKDGTNGILSAVNKSYQRIGCIYFLGLIMLSFIYPVFIKVEGIAYYQVFLIVFFSGFANVIAFFKQGKYRILLSADGKEYILSNLYTVTAILTNLLKIALISLHIQVHIVIILAFAVSLIQVIFIEKYIKKNYEWINLRSIPNNSELCQSGYALAHQVSGLVFSNTDVFLLTLFGNLMLVSVYGIYKVVITHVTSLIAIPYNACSYALGQLFHADREEYKRCFDAVQVLFVSFAISILTVAYILMPSFISLYTKGVNDISYADVWLPALFVIVELLNVIRIPTRHLVNCAGHFQETVSRTIVETFINLTVSIAGVLTMGIHGVLFGTIVALLYRSIDFAIYANKVILKRNPYRNLMLYAVNSVFAILIILLVGNPSSGIDSYMDFIIVGLKITPIIIVAFLTINYILFRNELRYFVKKMKKRFLNSTIDGE